MTSPFSISSLRLTHKCVLVLVETARLSPSNDGQRLPLMEMRKLSTGLMIDSVEDDAESTIRQLKEEITRLRQENDALHRGRNEVSNDFPRDQVSIDGKSGQHHPRQQQLANEDIERYSRQLILEDGFGVEGQCKLLSSSVLVVGAGGIGSTVILYLAASGVGKLTVVDFDGVEIANLHRQIIHNNNNVGQNKAVSACRAVHNLNPTVQCIAIQQPFTHDNALELVSSHDCIVDASDNPRTRYLINDACVLADKPLVSGGAIGTEGQVSVYNHKGGCCYRCLYPTPDRTEGCRSCSDHGVLGTVPGLIGILQATETLKVLTGIGTTIHDRLLMYDALRCSFLSIKKPPRRKDCPVCGSEPIIRDIVASGNDLTCTRGPTGTDAKIDTPTSTLPSEMNVSCSEYSEIRQKELDHILLDVRVTKQFELCSLEGAINMPLAQLKGQLEELEKLSNGQKPIYCLCRRGIASSVATELLIEAKTTSHPQIHSVFNIAGGLQAWRKQVDESFPNY